MFKAFKALKLWYEGITMAGDLLIIFGIGSRLDIALALLWVFACAFIFGKMANKRYMKIA